MDTHLYGRKVYEIMQYWEDADQDPDNPDHMKEYARRWQKQTKIVFSTTLNEVKNGYELRNSVDPDEIRQWKQSSGKNMLVGGASLALSFMKQRLVDEVHLYILPILLGGGKPMFPVDEKLELEFLESQNFSGRCSNVEVSAQKLIYVDTILLCMINRMYTRYFLFQL